MNDNTTEKVNRQCGYFKHERPECAPHEWYLPCRKCGRMTDFAPDTSDPRNPRRTPGKEFEPSEVWEVRALRTVCGDGDYPDNDDHDAWADISVRMDSLYPELRWLKMNVPGLPGDSYLIDMARRRFAEGNLDCPRTLSKLDYLRRRLLVANGLRKAASSDARS